MPAFMAIPDLVSEWIAWATFSSRTPDAADQNPHFAAFDEFLWITHEHPQLAWEAILAVFADPGAIPHLGHLAAGPVEDLLGYHGATFIDRVEDLAREDQQFASMLCGVWQFNMTEDIWARVQAAMPESPDSACQAANDG